MIVGSVRTAGCATSTATEVLCGRGVLGSRRPVRGRGSQEITGRPVGHHLGVQMRTNWVDVVQWNAKALMGQPAPRPKVGT